MCNHVLSLLLHKHNTIITNTVWKWKATRYYYLCPNCLTPFVNILFAMLSLYYVCHKHTSRSGHTECKVFGQPLSNACFAKRTSYLNYSDICFICFCYTQLFSYWKTRTMCSYWETGTTTTRKNDNYNTSHKSHDIVQTTYTYSLKISTYSCAKYSIDDGVCG